MLRADRLRGRDGHDRTDALPAAENRVTHRFVDDARRRIRRRKVGVDGPVDERTPGVEVLA